MGKGKHAKTECVKLGNGWKIKSRVEPVTVSPVEGVSKTCALFALLSILKVATKSFVNHREMESVPNFFRRWFRL